MTTAERFDMNGPRRRRALAASFALISHGMLLLGLSRLQGTTPTQATTSIAVEITTRLVQPPALRPQAKAEGRGLQHPRAERRAAPRQA